MAHSSDNALATAIATAIATALAGMNANNASAPSETPADIGRAAITNHRKGRKAQASSEAIALSVDTVAAARIAAVTAETASKKATLEYAAAKTATMPGWHNVSMAKVPAIADQTPLERRVYAEYDAFIAQAKAEKMTRNAAAMAWKRSADATRRALAPKGEKAAVTPLRDAIVRDVKAVCGRIDRHADFYLVKGNANADLIVIQDGLKAILSVLRVDTAAFQKELDVARETQQKAAATRKQTANAKAAKAAKAHTAAAAAPLSRGQKAAATRRANAARKAKPMKPRKG